MRKAIAIVAGVVVLAGVNWTIWQRERQIETGLVVRLELAPIDPRSLMQGDYMALRFAVADQAVGRRAEPRTEDGRIVVMNDDKGIARFVRRDDGKPLAQGEVALKYRVRDDARNGCDDKYTEEAPHLPIPASHKSAGYQQRNAQRPEPPTVSELFEGHKCEAA